VGGVAKSKSREFNVLLGAGDSGEAIIYYASVVCR
jgi:hypothetical protein